MSCMYAYGHKRIEKSKVVIFFCCDLLFKCRKAVKIARQRFLNCDKLEGTFKNNVYL